MHTSVDYLGRIAQAALRRRRPFVLCYHGVAPVLPPSDPRGLFVTNAQFEAHLDLIEEQGYELVSVSELWGLMQSGVDVSQRAAITFDDGLACTMHEAMPILARRGASCSMFVSTGLLGGPHSRLEKQQIMSPAEVLELAESGMEVGTHTVDHVRLPGMPYRQALDQLRRSRAFLEDLLNRPVNAMAYPFGAFDAQTVRAAEESGYEIACGCTGPAPWRALSLPREPIFPNTTKLRLRLKMAGLFGPVHASTDLRRAMRTVRHGPDQS